MRLFHAPFPSASSSLIIIIVLSTLSVSAIPLDLSDQESIKTAAGIAAHGLMQWYQGNETGQTPGLLPAPYYWWEAGAMFMSLIDYWSYTGDTTYNDLVLAGILWQVGPAEDFMVPNQTSTTGNDDQAFWGMAAMGAAELGFPNPPHGQPQWLALAQAVFDTQVARWDTEHCNGGLRWQVYFFNKGYNYKNTISQGGLFNLAARLARYTGNSTYMEWAERIWDWTYNVGLISPDMHFYDGTDLLLDCLEINYLEFTYNAGVFLHGAANMYSVNGSDVWADRVDRILNTTLDHFFESSTGIMYERACEPQANCNQDMRSFKAYLSRWLAFTTQLTPWTYDIVMPKLQTSAAAAAKQCSGGESGQVCGLRWTEQDLWDGWYGPGEQMAAMAVIGANLVQNVPIPETGITISVTVEPDIGDGSASTLEQDLSRSITKQDRAGAIFLTVMLAVLTVGTGIWACV